MTMTDQSISDLEAVYLKALEVRNFEITQLVQRNNFFMIFQGVLLAGVLQSEGKIPSISLVVSLIGLALSVAQYRTAAGAKFWQERWEFALAETERKLQRAYGQSSRSWTVSLFHRVSAHDVVRNSLGRSSAWGRFFFDPLILIKPSVSRIPIYAGMLLAIGWGAIAGFFAVAWHAA